MKKLSLFILIIFTLSIHAQRPKDITFVDTTLVRNLNNSIISFSKPFQAVDLENDGYLISNLYDDGNQKLKFLFTKLNVDGTHQFDTIYNFNFRNGSNSFGKPVKLGSKTLFVSNTDNDQPFVFALDNSTGGFLWSKVYKIDNGSVFSPSGIAANDSLREAVVYGNDIPRLLNTGTSFAFKIDDKGNALWTKDIGFPMALNNQISIKSAVATNDGGYIFAAKGVKKIVYEEFFSLMKLDSSGNKVWENNFNIVNQSGNDTIQPSFGKFPNEVITFDDSSATFIGSYVNAKQVEAVVIINFNPTTGKINHSKKLYLNSGATHLINAVKDKAYNGIALNFNDNRDYVNPNNRLVKLDEIGNFRSSHRIIESTHNTSTSANDAFIHTNDNGFLTVKKRRDSSNNFRGYFISKLDKDFYSSCVDTISEQLVVEDINTYSVKISSTINNDLNITANDSIIGTTTTNVSFGNVCKCRLSISGQVKDNQSNLIDSATVFLYKIKTSGAYSVFDSTITSGNGEYIFDFLPEEKFIIKVISNIPNTVNTYCGNPKSQNAWDSAWVFDLSCKNPNLKDKDMTLIPTVPQSGNGSLKGYVYELKGFDNNLSKGKFGKNKHRFEKALGDPIPGIDITLNQQSAGAVGLKQTDKNGAYDFTGLNVGKSYTLQADIPGLPNDSVYSIDIKVGKTSYDSLNFYVDSVEVYILGSTTGIEVFNKNNLNISLAPNPTSNKVNLVFNTVKNNEALVKVLSSTGALLIEKEKQLNSGSSAVELDLISLTNGIYFIQIQLDNSVIIKKVVKK